MSAALCATLVHLMLLVVLVASAPDANAQSRRRGAARAIPESQQAIDTVAPTGIAGSSEEPADLAFRTVNGTNLSLAGRERSVSAAPHLTQSDLRVIDIRGRGNEPLVPLRGYPTSERRTIPNRPGYVEARLGLFPTAQLNAGYSGSSWPFDYNAKLMLDISGGYVDNPHRRIGAALGAGYIINEGHGIFSGGHMGAELAHDNYSYRLFARADNPTRRSSNWNVSTTGANTSAGFTYDAGARYRSLSIADDSVSSKETSLEGALALGTSWKKFAIGASTDLRLTNLDGHSISYGRIHAFGSYSNRYMTARAGLQFAAGANSDGSTSGTIAPMGELRLFPLQGLMIIGTITGGLAPNTMSGLSAINPYIALRPNVKHQRENIGYQLHVRIEPTRMFALRVSAARSHYNDYAYFDAPTNAVFAPQYGSAIVNRITGDLSWNVDDQNIVLGSLEFNEGEIDDRRSLPLTPRWTADLLYTHRFAAIPISLDGSVRYIGARPASESQLDAVALLNIAARYAVTQRIDVSLDVRNLLHRRYELWEGYLERGIYASVGASARF
ncbi:MAG: hypothetical protein H7X80_11005 [bacterium]|nr:hypothetical protein [Candidatus Kapabacteria bacterium]